MDLNPYVYGLTRVNSYTYKCRCPVCGDSKSDLSKKRFYFLLNKDIVYCHNCGYSNKIRYFIREYFPEVGSIGAKSIAIRNMKDKLSNRKTIIVNECNSSMHDNNIVLELCVKFGLEITIPDMYSNFISKRRLELRDHGELWYMNDFRGFSNSILNMRDGSDYKCIVPSFDPRIFIPFYDEDGNIYAAQGRALLNTQQPKYITVVIDESKPKLYNYKFVDYSSRVYVTEGPIDSMFIPNSIASGGSNISAEARNELEKIDDIVYVFDRDFSYNVNVRDSIRKFINSGGKIFLPPEEFGKSKDINDYVIENGTVDGLVELIDSNSFSGVLAIAKISQFRKKRGDIGERNTRYNNWRRTFRS